MSDDRNTPAGPPPEPPAPPPLAAPLPPAPPPAPAYAAPPAGGAAKASPLPWVIAGILGLTLVVLVILYFFTDVLDKPSRYGGTGSGSGRSSFGTSGSAYGGSTGSAGYGSPSGTLSISSLAGTWGPRCPGSRAEAVTFTSSGGWSAGAGGGTYALSGNTITLFRSSGGNSFTMTWVPLSETSARVTAASGGRPDTVYRCSTY